MKWRLTDRELDLARPLGLGIVNVTDDSFFSGARSGTAVGAITDGVRLASEGFDLIDLGAVAARNGPTVSIADEASRLIPAIEGLARRIELPISADTFNPVVARLAVAAGAAAINDISGGSEAIFEAVAETGCGYVLMHIEGPPRVERPKPDYPDVVARLLEFFAERIELAQRYGVDREQIVVDPGLDFDLDLADNLAILNRLDALAGLGRPIFMSLSRKDFLGAILAGSWVQRLPPGRCEAATAAATALAVSRGALLHRLHDRSALDAMRVAAAIRDGADGG